jgi:hypothetical protein
MNIRRTLVIKDSISFEGGLPAIVPVTRVAASAVIANPLAGIATDDLGILVPFGETLGKYLAQLARKELAKPALSYGKGAIVGTSGEIEHAAAIVHPRMGKPMREAVGGGQAIIPSNVKIGAVGACIDIPLGQKDDVWSFDHIDTITVTLPGAPRPDEIVVVVALADGGRPRPRVANSGAVPPKDNQI